MIISFETQLGSFSEDIKRAICDDDTELLSNTECSIFLRDPKKDTYILRASPLKRAKTVIPMFR